MTRRRASAYLPLLRTGRWFAGIPAPLGARLVDAAVLRTVAAGRPVIPRRSASGGLYAVVDGAVRLVTAGSGGRRVLLMLLEPPSWLGELSVIDGQPGPDAIAEVETTVAVVAQPALERLLAAEPALWPHLARLVAYRLRLALLAFQDASEAPPLVRLARRLALLVEGYGDHTHARRTVGLGQAQLAQMMAVSRQTTNGLLRDLAGRGLIKLSYGRVEVLDAAGLRAIGGL